MDKGKIKKEKRTRRHNRIRAKVIGSKEVPRFSVFKSNLAVSVQFIDDDKKITLLSGSTNKISGKTLLEKSKNLGLEIAKEAVKKGIKKVVFDRGGYIYTGKIQALAEGAREGGLKF